MAMCIACRSVLWGYHAGSDALPAHTRCVSRAQGLALGKGVSKSAVEAAGQDARCML